MDSFFPNSLHKYIWYIRIGYIYNYSLLKDFMFIKETKSCSKGYKKMYVFCALFQHVEKMLVYKA